MNQRKELVITYTQTKRESFSSLHYASAGESKPQKMKTKMPDYVQNM
jgi:hypothetical protein